MYHSSRYHPDRIFTALVLCTVFAVAGCSKDSPTPISTPPYPDPIEAGSKLTFKRVELDESGEEIAGSDTMVTYAVQYLGAQFAGRPEVWAYIDGADSIVFSQAGDSIVWFYQQGIAIQSIEFGARWVPVPISDSVAEQMVQLDTTVSVGGLSIAVDGQAISRYRGTTTFAFEKHELAPARLETDATADAFSLLGRVGHTQALLEYSMVPDLRLLTHLEQRDSLSLPLGGINDRSHLRYDLVSVVRGGE